MEDNGLLSNDAISKKYGKELPYFLMGHSMGSFLARTYLVKYPGDVDGAVIMGTGHQGGAIISGGKIIGKILEKTSGPKKQSDLVMKLTLGRYAGKIKNARTFFDWLSVNEENVDRFLDGYHTAKALADAGVSAVKVGIEAMKRIIAADKAKK